MEDQYNDLSHLEKRPNIDFLNVFSGRKVNKSPAWQETIHTLTNGFREALRGCGFLTPKRYMSELWKWETMQDEDVCEDCQERASWPAMDIADWMKEGMPGTPEAETRCGENCRCQLVRYDPHSSFKKHQRRLS